MESISIVSCAYKDRLGEKVTATEKYTLSKVYVERYTEVIGLCAQLISAKLKKKKKTVLLLTNKASAKYAVSRVMTATDNTYRTQRA